MRAPAISKSVLITQRRRRRSAGGVERVIERTIASARPRPHYVVTAAARILLGLEWLLPNRAFDSLLRLQLHSFGA